MKKKITALFCLFFCIWCGCSRVNPEEDIWKITDLEPTGVMTETGIPTSMPELPEAVETILPTKPAEATNQLEITEASEITEALPSPTPTPKPSVTLAMVGDILLHTRIHEYSRQEDGSYNYDTIFEHLTGEISAADLALVNQEVILGGKTLGVSGYPTFNAPEEIGDALVKAGFDVVLHATNHALDKRKQGIQNCLEFWQENYPEIAVLGIHDSAQSQENLYITEVEGIRIAILNYTYGTNGVALPEDMPFAVDLLEEEKVKEDLTRAGEQADFIIVCPHWGTEYVLHPDSSQKKWAQLFLDYGADLVLGTHPHVIEPVEWLTDETDGKQMLVYYSLGNFVNWTSGTVKGTANRMVGGMATVTIELDETEKAYIADYGVRAVVCHVENRPNGITVYPLEDYTEELAGQNAIRSQDDDFSYSYCVDLCNQVWGDLWN